MKRTPPDAATVMARTIILKYIFVKGLSTPPLEYLADCKKRWSSEQWNRFLEEVGAQNAQLIQRLRQAQLWNAMDRKEQDFMEANPAEIRHQALVDASWLPDSMVCLLWALGLISELLPYHQQANPELTNKLPAEAADALMKKANLRPGPEIEKQRDVAELWHWRSRMRQLQESGTKHQLPHGMTLERIVQMASAKAAADGAIPSPIGNDFPAFGKAYRDMAAEEYSQATSIAQERHRALNWLCGYAPGNRWSETPTDT